MQSDPGNSRGNAAYAGHKPGTARKEKICMKIISFWGENVNLSYHPDRTSNGGGYFQPCGGALIDLEDGRLIEVTYLDESCGDFGYRLFMEVQTGCFGWRVYWDTMDPQFIDEMTENFYNVADACLAADGIDLKEVYDLVRCAVEWAAWQTIEQTSCYS